MFKPLKKGDQYIPGNSVKLVRGGAEYFDLLEKLIQSARYSIHFHVYIFDDDQTGQRIAKALKDATSRGVRTYMMLDAYASKNLSKAFIADLRTSGIHFKWFAPMFKGRKFYLGRRLHHKVVVVDSLHGLVAGLNISDRYNDTEKAPAWLDWALFVEGDIGRVLERICVRRYKGRLPHFPDMKIKNIALKGIVKDSAVRARINDWIGRRWQISRSYLEMFRTAKESITIMSPYFLPGVIFRRAIAKASERGVKINVILAGISDIGTSKYAERYLYRWLFKHNIGIYEYEKNVLHGKIAVCDNQWITIGSYNLNNLSAYASVELNLDVANEQVAVNTHNCLTTIMQHDCTHITEEHYHQSTGVFTHVLQKIAFNLLRLAAFFVIRKRE